ncbi:MAG: LPS export ABC transporter periplasmic protein LptC [Bacteroidales bacterium]|jgi:LPS export ABC transporter protein LptC|nr:LPS export ABC transporter periplasmic protein LptC [Bacteroidales bacterium]
MMFYQPRIWLFITLVALLAISCRQQNSSLVLEEGGPDQTMKNATIQYTDSGRLKMITFGEEILNFDDEDETQEFPKGIKATFYDEITGKITSIITADEATNRQKKKLMQLRKNVVINNIRDGKITYTEEFFWNQDKGKIFSNVPVLQIGKDGSRHSGDGFESDEDMVNFRLIRPRGSAVID